MEAAKAEADAWRDKYFRLHAEWDTYRRRMNEQREEEKLRATEKLVESLIPVIDDFERSMLMRKAMAKRVCSVASKPFTTRSARC